MGYMQIGKEAESRDVNAKKIAGPDQLPLPGYKQGPGAPYKIVLDHPKFMYLYFFIYFRGVVSSFS